MNTNQELNIVLEGKGNSKESALTNAIAGLQKHINTKIRGTIIRIEPLEVKFLEGTQQTYTEKFLFLFMKREVSVFYLKVEIKVRVFVIDSENFDFKVIKSNRKFFS